MKLTNKAFLINVIVDAVLYSPFIVFCSFIDKTGTLFSRTLISSKFTVFRNIKMLKSY